MLPPARSVPPPELDVPDDPSPSRSDSDGRRVRPADRRVLVLGLLAALAALAFPFAPVQQPEVTYRWSAADGPAAAIPLMPYQPVDLTASVSCAAARAAGDRVLLSTVPLRPDPAADPLAGLRITGADGELRIATAGAQLAALPIPAGDCSISVVSNYARTAVLLDGAPVVEREGDLRPGVAGAFTELPSTADVALALTADTRFQTAIGPLKAALAALCLLGLFGMLAALRRADRAATAPVRLLPQGWWCPRPVDWAVGALLTVWWVVGPLTVDDGYIAGIVRSRGTNGVIGNVYRWLNAPEAPFSWFYDLYYAWSLISTSTLWMRLPSTLLGLLCWWLLSRLVLPRLGRFTVGRAVPWLAAAAFATWWLPFNLGLRPEPWVAVGGLAVFLGVERAIAGRRMLPLAVALVLAGATTAVTPGGILAFAPFLAAAVPLLRMLRRRTDLHRAPLLAVLVAAPAAALLLMFADQSLAGMLEATRVRALIGGGLPWYQEYERYAALLSPADIQGGIGRRAAALFTLLAAAGVAWTLAGRHRSGVAAGPARRLLVGFVLGLAMMTASPTKWTHHFGGLAGYGAAVLLLGLVAWSGSGLRNRTRTGRPIVAGLGAVTVVAALVLAGYNVWPYASNWFAPTWSTVVPHIAGVPLATVTLVLGAAVVLGLLARCAWRRSGGARAARPWLPAPAPVVLVVLVAVLALQVLGLARVAAENRDSYTLASDALATLTGEPCGLQRLLSVETDPAAGVLPVRSGAQSSTTTPVSIDVGGSVLPGIAVAGTGTTDWFALDPTQRSGELPVVVTLAGDAHPGDALFLEFSGPGFSGADRPVERRRLQPPGPEPRDDRQLAPAGATAVRLVVDAAPAGLRPSAVASLPRVPRVTPMTDVLPPGSSAILDWPVAFLFPCLSPEPLPLGTAGLAQWRVGPPALDPAAGITYTAGFGGPFVAPRLLVTEQRMATYLSGDPTRDAAQLYRWIPVVPLNRLEPTVARHEVAGWHADGRTRVPGPDPVG